MDLCGQTAIDLKQTTEQLDVLGRYQLQTGKLCLGEPSDDVVLVTTKVCGLSAPTSHYEQVMLRRAILLREWLFKDPDALEALRCYAEFLYEFAHEGLLRRLAMFAMPSKNVPGAGIVVPIGAPVPKKDTAVLHQDSA